MSGLRSSYINMFRQQDVAAIKDIDQLRKSLVDAEYAYQVLKRDVEMLRNALVNGTSWTPWYNKPLLYTKDQLYTQDEVDALIAANGGSTFIGARLDQGSAFTPSTTGSSTDPVQNISSTFSNGVTTPSGTANYHLDLTTAGVYLITGGYKFSSVWTPAAVNNRFTANCEIRTTGGSSVGGAIGQQIAGTRSSESTASRFVELYPSTSYMVKVTAGTVAVRLTYSIAASGGNFSAPTNLEDGWIFARYLGA